MKEEMVTITKCRYDELMDSEWKLVCLENYGVDNWIGYGDAMEEYWNEQED